jgi:methyl-accepting chemotaxis protein
MNLRKKLLLAFLSITLIMVISGLFSIVQIQNIHAANKNLGLINAPLNDAAMEIKLTATTAHLWIEEIIGGTESKSKIKKVWQLLDETRWYCDAMLKGGQNDEGVFYPVNDKVIEDKIISVKKDLAQFRKGAQLRFEKRFGTDQATVPTSDDDFDALFDQFITDADAVESLIQAKMKRDTRYVDRSVEINKQILIVSIAASLVIALSLGFKMAQAIAAPIRYATQLATAAAKGDFSQSIETRYKNRRDEIGNLLNALDKMTHDLNALVTETVALKDEALRINEALGNAKASVLIVDNTYRIIYANHSVQQLFQARHVEFNKTLPQLNLDCLIGQTLDKLYTHPTKMHHLLENLTTFHQAKLDVPDLYIDMHISPVIDATGQRLGWVLELDDRTTEVATEEEINTVMSAASQGDFSQRLDLVGKTGFFKVLSEKLNQTLHDNQQMIEELMQVFATLAKGNLTHTLTRHYAGVLGRLKEDVNTTIHKLNQVIEAVKQTIDTVHTGAKEIARGNVDLSQRTEEQAASLEETAASTEQMTSSVQQNTDHTCQAAELANQVQEQAQRNGNVADTAIKAMAEINNSSERIADIISVIDDLAFQTNLLALNAAVEAARAGEQGRGFAVVATEVRNLAQRSAEAAREIKGLIKESVDKIEQGSRLVNQSSEALTNIVAAIKKVSDIISEIAAASREQSTGIHQVNKAIAQMDEMTQQNASLVEESASASEIMREQAENLQRHIAFFHTKTELT